MSETENKDPVIKVRQDPDDGSWSVFSKTMGHGFMLDNVESKERAVEQASRILKAIHIYGVEGYRDHDWDDAEFSEYPEWEVIEENA